MNPTEAPPRTPPQGASLFLGYWLPVIVYVALIFTASSIPGRDIPTLFTNSDKLEHLAEYALFGLLLGLAHLLWPTPLLFARVHQRLARALVQLLGSNDGSQAAATMLLG